jgi:cyclase
MTGELYMSNITNLPTSTFFTLEQLADGIFVAIIKDGQGAWGNAGIIDLGDEVLIVDTFLTPNAAMELRRVAEEITGKNIKYVVNTHAHLDHTLGNQVFADTKIIATDQTLQQLQTGMNFTAVEVASTSIIRHIEILANNIKAERNPIAARSRLWEVREFQKLLEAIPEINLTLPNVTYETDYVIKGTKRKVEIYTYGGGHSKSDAFLYLPEEKIIFAGDLVFVQNHPSIHTQTPDQWISILNKMKQFEVKQIVVGHGPVGNQESIDTMISYLNHLKTLVEDGIQQGKTVDELLANPMPEEYQSWGMLQVYSGNLKKLYNQKVNSAEQ